MHPICTHCPHNKPGCLVCSAGVLRVHEDEGIRSPRVCAHFEYACHDELEVSQ